MAVEFRYAQVGEYPRISKFLDEYWAKDHVYVRMPQLFEWTFRRGSVWDQEGYSFAIAEARDEIVGILGGIPFAFNWCGRTSQAVWLVNFMLRPDYRRGPTALRLLSMFRRAPYTTVIAFGNNPAIVPMYRALGAQTLAEMPRHFVVLPDAVQRMTSLLCMTYPDWPVQRAEGLAAAFRLAALPDIPGQSGTTVPTSWNDCDWPQWAVRVVGAARDFDYLQWRYFAHPCFAYRCITVPEGDRLGIAIWRLETMRRTVAHTLEAVDQIGRLVEFLPVSPHNARELLALFWQELAAADALGADYYGYQGEIGTWLRTLGFYGVESHHDGPAIPARFQPLEGKGGQILSAIFAPRDVPSCSSDRQCLWYWTKSDSDQDRPN